MLRLILRYKILSKWIQYQRCLVAVMFIMTGGLYIVNLHECNSIEGDSITLYVNGNNATYSDIFGAEYIPKEIENFIGNYNIITNTMPRHCVDVFISH